MKIRSLQLTIIVFSVFILGIGSTMAFNIWHTESAKIPVKISEGDFAGQYNPADIRGSYSFSDIEKSFQVPVLDLARAFAVDSLENPAEFQCKELEEIYASLEDGEVGTDSVRYFVALYTGLPHTPEVTTRIPLSALTVLENKISKTKMDEIKQIAIDVTSISADHVQSAEHIDTNEEEIIKGGTTFQDLLNWGLSESDLETVVGLDLSDLSVSIRDFCVDNNIEFKDIRDSLQDMVDSKSP